MSTTRNRVLAAIHNAPLASSLVPAVAALIREAAHDRAIPPAVGELLDVAVARSQGIASLQEVREVRHRQPGGHYDGVLMAISCVGTYAEEGWRWETEQAVAKLAEAVAHACGDRGDEDRERLWMRAEALLAA